MSGRTLFESGLESLAAKLIEKYPDGYLSEIEVGWPCGIAVRAPVDGLDTPRAIIRGTYQELRAFETVYEQIRRVAKVPAHVVMMDYQTSPAKIEGVA